MTKVKQKRSLGPKNPTILKGINAQGKPAIGRLVNRRATSAILVCTLAILALVVAVPTYNYWDNYRDRPLAEGFTYVGRDYQSGCLLLLCMGSYHDVLFYATDIEPEGAVRQFPEWRADPIVDKDKWYGGTYQEQVDDPLSRRACKRMFRINSSSQQIILALCYTKDQETVYTDYRDNKLKPVHKKYLVAVNGDIYRKAMEK